MEILDFHRFKMLLEAEGDEAPAEETQPEAVEPPAPEEVAADPVADVPMPDTGFAGASPVSADPFASAALPPDPNAPAPAAQSSTVKFVMLDTDKDWHSTYDDGGGVKRYSEYELETGDVEKWIEENGLSAEKEQIMQSFQGKKAMPAAAYDKLKKSLRSDSIGKDRGDIDIDYDDKGVPATSDLNVVFIKKAD